MADAADLKSAARKGLWVRIPPPAPLTWSAQRCPADDGVIVGKDGSQVTGPDLWRSPGTQGAQVEIVEYNPEWPCIFEHEAAVIMNACRPWITDVHHFGSTSVPGLAAKPTLDIVPIADSSTECTESVSAMTGLGYRYRGENGIPGRFYFDKIVDGRTAVHAHMFPAAHPDVRKHLAFRDYLRTHPDAARNYELLKQRLASKYRDDRLAYTEAKAEFINRIIAMAGADIVAKP